jgi:hypothetical protein
MCRLRHINDPVLSSLKMEGIRLLLGQVAGSCGYGVELSSSINAGNFLTSCKVYWLASQEELCSMEYLHIHFELRTCLASWRYDKIKRPAPFSLLLHADKDSH